MKQNSSKSIQILLPLSIFFFWTTVAIAQISPAQNVRFRSQLKVDSAGGANICGYASKGREYAIVGTLKGTVIVDVTNPDVPVKLKLIPAVQSKWREIKVYKNHAYVTTEGSGQGLQIINLSTLPDTNVVYKDYKSGDNNLTNIAKIHALHVDTAKGFVYLFGGSSTLSTGVNVNGAIVLDLKDPWNPTFAGYFNKSYIHDGYVNNDTLYGGHIYDGYFSVIDFKDKNNPIILGTKKTPLEFTHNTWPSLNGKVIFTTDERAGSYLAAYDVSDVTNLKLLDKIRTGAGEAAIVHNTHILRDFAITSWYTEGVTIVDAHRPQNLVQVGQYDTYNGAGAVFSGCWGVYPYLPSGNLITSSIEGDLHVLTPQYVRASYLEGIVIDSITRKPIIAVKVKINSNDVDKAIETNATGNYYTGQATAGLFSVTYSRSGYYSKTVEVSLSSDQVTLQDIELKPRPRFIVSGNVVSNIDDSRLGNGIVYLKGTEFNYTIRTDTQGAFLLNDVMDDTYEMFVGAWGYRHRKITNQVITRNLTGITVRLDSGYQDDFWGDFGWEISGTLQPGANQGRWERAVPIQINFDTQITGPGADNSTDLGSHCYVTGNGGGDGGANDVDGGPTVLTSPVIKLKNSKNPILTFSYWFVNTGGSGTPNDTLDIYMSNGVTEKLILSVTQSASQWRHATVNLKDFLPLTDSMRLRLSVSDDTPGHIVEAAFDAFKISELTSVTDIANNWQLKTYPNPFSYNITVDFQLDNTAKNAQLKVYNLVGQVVETASLSHMAQTSVYTEGSKLQTSGGVTIGEKLPAGIYFIRIESENKVSRIERIVKN